MKRHNLRVKLADAIERVMKDHRLTVPNVMRYCNAEVRSSFSIRKDTIIKLEDWETAIELVNMRKYTATKIEAVPPNLEREFLTPVKRTLGEWKKPLRERIKQLIRPDTEEYKTRMSLLESATTKNGYFAAIKRWKDQALLEARVEHRVTN